MTTSPAEEVLAFIEQHLESPASDGLPVVPPTAKAMDRMIKSTGLDGELVLGKMPPSLDEVKVRHVALYGVMAGCRPEYAPVLVAVVRGMMDEAFDLYGIACSTKGSAPVIVVNGPVRREQGFNASTNAFGPGFRANSTIGRAVRLMILGLAGAVPGGLDRATLGHPGKFACCIAEDEENSPWEPLHVERGLPSSASAVTLFGGEGIRQVNMHYNSPDAVLAAVADTLATTGVLSDHNITGRSPHLIVFAHEHQEMLHNAGWTKRTIKEYLAEHAVLSPERLRAVGSEADRPSPIIARPEDVLIVACGGIAGRFAGIVTGWSWQSQPVTVEVG